MAARLPRLDAAGKVDRPGIEKLAPRLAWGDYFRALGYADLRDLTVDAPAFFQGLNDLVVTDGSAVLGLGNIGARPGLPVIERIAKEGDPNAFPLPRDTPAALATSAVLPVVRNGSPASHQKAFFARYAGWRVRA